MDVGLMEIGKWERNRQSLLRAGHHVTRTTAHVNAPRRYVKTALRGGSVAEASAEMRC